MAAVRSMKDPNRQISSHLRYTSGKMMQTPPPPQNTANSTSLGGNLYTRISRSKEDFVRRLRVLQSRIRRVRRIVSRAVTEKHALVSFLKTAIK